MNSALRNRQRRRETLAALLALTIALAALAAGFDWALDRPVNSFRQEESQ